MLITLLRLGFKKVRINTLKHIENEFKNYLMAKLGITNTIMTTMTKAGLSKVIITGILILL